MINFIFLFFETLYLYLPIATCKDVFLFVNIAFPIFFVTSFFFFKNLTILKYPLTSVYVKYALTENGKDGVENPTEPLIATDPAEILVPNETVVAHTFTLPPISAESPPNLDIVLTPLKKMLPK